ncbi:microcompartment protein CcmL/EutN [Enterococcus sp. PF1-24]|uniref:BMC domain-containing protein n=1 Tax=unclassified Enterococcus TaxID=2608891 RepID=UPI00247515A1|nr:MULTISPECIES: BMC domain-containing protein [unclassified Enterococcus]MDH6363326.1 microcompartment protein CcmL/EutN [Enterococcus sp. PFB1-1]MDH6400373.1 microcompartment protein CcmL/EutN [Enterococcus sp. PF1-24]
MIALGMIEVRGYLGAISAADAALKAANVNLNNAEIIRGGLTTIEVVGDVAAVKAAIDAGTQVAKELNCLISSHVIARLDEQTEEMMRKKVSEEEVIIEIVEEPVIEEVVAVEEFIEIEEPVAAITEVAPATDERAELMKMKVVDLRKKAYQMNLTTLTKKEIKFANKTLLVETILAELERSDSE